MTEVLRPVYIPDDDPDEVGHVEIHGFNPDDPEDLGDFAGFDPTADEVRDLCSKMGMTDLQFREVWYGTEQFHNGLVDDVYATSPTTESRPLRRAMGVRFIDMIARNPAPYTEAIHTRSFRIDTKGV